MVAALVQSGQNNGTVTPATPGSLTTTAGNFLVLCIAVQGTNPTIGSPAGWTQIQNRTATAALTVAIFMQPNTAGGATNPSSALGGTIVGWVATMFEYSGVNPIAPMLSNTGQGLAATTLVQNIFAVGNAGSFVGTELPQTNILFVYCLARLTATTTTVLLGLGGTGAWSASIQPVAGVQGLSMDFYWGFNSGSGPFPNVSATLGSSVVAIQIAAWFNTPGSQSITQVTASGPSGSVWPPYNQGSIGIG